MKPFRLKWWQTWQCSWCHAEGRKRLPCENDTDDSACPVGVVARWRWMRRALRWFVGYFGEAI